VSLRYMDGKIASVVPVFFSNLAHRHGRLMQERNIR